MIIGIEVAEILHGMYRQNIFREALRANGLQNHKGIFAYSKIKEKLILFDMIPIRSATGETIMEMLTSLSVKAGVWKMAIDKGEMPSLESVGVGSSKKSGGMFGLK